MLMFITVIVAIYLIILFYSVKLLYKWPETLEYNMSHYDQHGFDKTSGKIEKEVLFQLWKHDNEKFHVIINEYKEELKLLNQLNVFKWFIEIHWFHRKMIEASAKMEKALYLQNSRT